MGYPENGKEMYENVEIVCYICLSTLTGCLQSTFLEERGLIRKTCTVQCTCTLDWPIFRMGHQFEYKLYSRIGSNF